LRCGKSEHRGAFAEGVENVYPKRRAYLGAIERWEDCETQKFTPKLREAKIRVGRNHL
jgi:hypothetical protein